MVLAGVDRGLLVATNSAEGELACLSRDVQQCSKQAADH